eukprot:jgi/Undpi1/8291/HiC_scaffold_25.g10760.m1
MAFERTDRLSLSIVPVSAVTPPRSARTTFAISPILATPRGGFEGGRGVGKKAWEDTEEGEEGFHGGGGEGRERHWEAEREKRRERRRRRRIRRLAYLILGLLGVVVAARWLGVGGDDDMPAIASSKDELVAVFKLAGIKAKPRQVDQAWSALLSGAARRTDVDPGPSGWCSSKGRVAAKLVLAGMRLDPGLSISGAVGVVVLVVFSCMSGRFRRGGAKRGHSKGDDIGGRNGFAERAMSNGFR